MTQTPFSFALYVVLYTLVWIALSLIIYHAFVFGNAGGLQAGPYFFMTGLLWLVCGAIRSVRPTAQARRTRRTRRDPVVNSFALSGLLLILYANLA